MRKLIAISFVLLAAFAASTAYAVQPDEIMSDPAKELRARDLSRELRCMVCQNQSIDDSEAPLARDLRLLVRERIAAGDSDAQVIDFLVARYGEFVLLKPRLNSHTWLLWLLPPLALAGGGLVLWATWPAPNQIRCNAERFAVRTNARRRGAAGTADRRTHDGQAGLARSSSAPIKPHLILSSCKDPF